MFDKQIRSVYDKLQQAASDARGPLNLDNLEQDLRDLVQECLGSRAPITDWTVEESLFDLGIDSLQALQIRRVLLSAASKTVGLDGLDIAKLIPPRVHLHKSLGP